MTNPIRKCLSMPHGATYDGGQNDYRYWGNDTEAMNSVTRWIKVWIYWEAVQGYQWVGNSTDAWASINANPWSVMQRLDDIIKRVNDDGALVNSQSGGSIGVILCVDASVPAWAMGAGTNFPADVSANSPWAWFIAHLCARYRQGVGVNPGGPSLAPGGNPYGNPYGAFIAALEICNEANYQWHPQANIHCTISAMMKNAEAQAAYWGAPPMLLAPGSLDTDNTSANVTYYGNFGAQILVDLAGWIPRMYFGWSQHNYNDVAQSAFTTPTTTRIATMQNVLSANSWKGGSDRSVWITEGGEVTTPGAPGVSEAAGATNLYNNYHQMMALPDVPIWCNHGIIDPSPPGPGGFSSGLVAADRVTPKAAKAYWDNPSLTPAANTAL